MPAERPLTIRAARFQLAQLIMCNDLDRDHDYRATSIYQALGRRTPIEAVEWVTERIIDPDQLHWVALLNVGAVWAAFEVQALRPENAELFTEEVRAIARARVRRVLVEHPRYAEQVPPFLRPTGGGDGEPPPAFALVVPRARSGG